ncbi:MAG TPA: glycosyl hydrolase family 18 protein, partial [Candidatus Deferrimicrobiaceae bacterium]|nr:glycosyl hydrolase family 18 protein [Candidatus Deferrimicrobiaceae bacterium]
EPSLEGVDQDGGATGSLATGTSWSASTGDENVAAAAVGENGLRREVFGFLPYWEVSGSVDLDYRTLSTIAYFSVGVTKAGNLKKTDSDGSLSTGWAAWTSSAMTSIINAAHAAGTRVVLTVSCFAWSSSGAEKQAALLGSASARANLAKQIAAAVRDRGADGVNLDFEPLVSGYAAEFTALVRSVRAELDKVAPGYQLTFDTTGYIGNYPIENATAPGGADAIFVMGYDYRGASSNVAGSISPLTGPKYDLTDTVAAYTARVSPSKLILGVPYYGRAWSTDSDALNAKNISGTKYGSSATATYRTAAALAAEHGRRWDPIEQGPWVAYRKQTCTNAYGCVEHWREVYFDDAASLKLRYDLVNRQDLRGAGIWALNYDKGTTELRKALADKFLDDRTPPLAGTAVLTPTQRDEGFPVTWTAYDDSTVVGFDLQVSADGGAWTNWLAGTAATGATYLGEQGRTYAFRVRATDSHGNLSAWQSIDSSATAAPDALTIGGFARVLADGLRMRTSASTGGSIMATLSAGDALQVVGGPKSADGYTWYQVSGPVRQWPPVDPIEVGGWVAASGGSDTYLAARKPVYATTVAAGLAGLTLNGGGARILSPNGDGADDTIRLDWTNAVAFDSLSLRILKPNGTLVGALAIPTTAAGAARFIWDGRLGGVPVADGTYIPQLVGTRGGTSYAAPAASPVGAVFTERYGIAVAGQPATIVTAFGPTIATLTRASTITYALSFGGAVTGLSAADFSRSGTATGCTVGPPAGSGAAYTISVTGCSSGTLALALKAGAVRDAVGNTGPAAQAVAATVRIDRLGPVVSRPRASFRTGVALRTSKARTKLPVELALSASDAGGAAVASFDVARSVDGGSFKVIATGVAGSSFRTWIKPGRSYRFKVRARDTLGNVGAWVVSPRLRPKLVQQSSSALRWKGTWRGASSTAYSGGSVRRATAAGARAKLTFTGRAIAFVSTRAPRRGQVKVYLDGSYVRTIDLYASSFTPRSIVFSRAWSSRGTHTIKLVVVGTAGRPRIDVDAFEVLR